MKVPSLNRMPSHSPPAGQSAWEDLVSGPRNVMKVLSRRRETAISKLLEATERKLPARSLRLRQTFSTKGEWDGLSSKVRIMRVFSYFSAFHTSPQRLNSRCLGENDADES